VARSYFGDANPIGGILTTDAGQDYRVTLVFADQPENTHFKYDVLFTDNNPNLIDPTELQGRKQRLFNVGLFTYVVMREGFNAADWANNSQAFYDEYMSEIGEANGFQWRSWLQPLADIHLHSSVDYDQPGGNLYYLYAFSAVAVF